MARKLTISTLDLETAKTIGLGIRDAAIQLDVWRKYWDSSELVEKFVLWLEHAKYRLSPLFIGNEKFHRIYKTGYTIQDQINAIITRLAGDGNDDVRVPIKEIAKHLDLGPEIKGENLLRTIYHNLDSDRLLHEDTNYWTQYLSKDNTAHTHYPPGLDSELHNIFKSRFNKETDG